MVKENLCSPELCKMLIDNGMVVEKHTNGFLFTEITYRCTFEQSLKWLRDTHNIHIYAVPGQHLTTFKLAWFLHIVLFDESGSCKQVFPYESSENIYKSEEDAIEAGILYILNKKLWRNR